MSNPTFSKLELAEHCPSAFALPQIQTESKATVAGRERHKFLERAAEIGREAALAYVPDEMHDDCEALPLDLFEPGFEPEKKVALNLRTGRAKAITSGGEREYGDLDDPDVICGTIDRVKVVGDRVLVDDFKGPRAYVTPAAHNAQLMAGALAAADLAGVEKATVRIIPLRGGDESVPDVADLDWMSLAAGRARLRKIVACVERAKSEEPKTFRPGPWCGHCSARFVCPAYAAPIAAMIQANDAAPLVIDDEAIRKIYRMPQILRDWADNLTAIIRGYLTFGAAVPLDGDRELALVVEHTRRFVPELVASALAEYGKDVVALAVKTPAPETSAEAFENAVKLVAKRLKAKGKKVTQDSVRRELESALILNGGMTRVPVEKVKTRKRESGS